MSKRDFYDVLGISRDADDKEIKSAYRKLAMKNHPDRNPDDEAAADRFREVSEAYEVLKDSQKRAAYDRLGHAAFDQQAGGGFGGGGFGGGGFGGGGFSDIFDQMFNEFNGGRGAASQNNQGSDLRYDMDITLEEAYSGVQKDIRVKVATACEPCSGTGAKAGSAPQNCETCNGVGKVRQQQGFFTLERTCPSCRGQGQIISDPCTSCAGEGRVNKTQNLAVTIPAGVDTGTRIRLSGKGEAGMRGGPAGDLYIFVEVRHHNIFNRDGNNLYMTVPVPMTIAALGGTIDVPTISGKMARLTIEAGTQSARKFRMRSKGMPALRGSGHGDQIVEIQVETPTELTDRQKELLAEFQEAGDTSPKATSWYDKIKGLFDDA